MAIEFRDVVKKYAPTDQALGVPGGEVGGIPVPSADDFATAEQGAKADTAVQPDDLGAAASMSPVEVVSDPDAQAALSGAFAQANPGLVAFFDRLTQGGRAAVLAIGDSTWNDGSDAFRTHIDQLAALVPERTVTYRLWDNSAQAFGPLSTRQTGAAGDRYFVAANGSSKFVASALDAALVTDDLDIEVKFAADDWDSFSGARFFCSDESSDPNRRWWLGMTAAGQVRLYWFPEGTNASVVQVNSTANLSSVVTPVDGQPLRIRATLDVDNGDGGYEVAFFVNGTPLGDVVVGDSTTNLIASTRGVTLGGRASGAAAMSGKVYAFTMRASIDGPIIAAFDADHLTDNVTGYTDEFGITWTPQGEPPLGGALGLLVLNCATAGQGPGYFVDPDRWAKMSAIGEVHVAYVAIGHNAGDTTDFTATWAALPDQIRASWPSAALVVSTQNPETAAATHHLQHAIRQRQIKEAAIARGYTLVDAYQGFLDYGGDWVADLMADAVHPNPTGSALWAALLTAPFEAARPR